MAINSKAYTVNINPEGSGLGEDGGVHQSSPTWVLTFVRWDYRDTLRTPTSDPFHIRNPVVVENDCVQVSVTTSKGTLTPSMSATLVQTDINYETAIAPGDFVFVNMLNWESDARRVADAARSGNALNGTQDGFKGLFKVQGVRKTLQTDPVTGTRTLVFRIDGFAFTEFNNTIYFNPNLINQKSLNNAGLFISDIATAWASFASRAGKPFVQEIMAFLIQNLIGLGVNPKAANAGGLVVSPNVHFLMPYQVGKYLGLDSVTSAKDIYSYIFGIQQYSGASDSAVDLSTGLNPSNLQTQEAYPGFFYTDIECRGNTILKPEYWNQVKLWSILNQYTNAPLNELYTCFRVSPDNTVLPTVVFRQIPFTSEDFVTQKLGIQDDNARSIPVTRFLTLPRWKISPDFVMAIDIGKDEAARVNFVQYYAKSNFSDKGIDISGETAAKNYVYDSNDIKRSGLRPYIVQVQFDDLPGNLVQSGPIWARVVGDAVIGGHLKLNGTISCPGMVDPIAVGDNLEFDNTVYHIEQIVHTCVVNPSNGIKAFRTSISVSHGVSINSSDQGTVYSEMAFADAYASRSNDNTIAQILPGVSEAQDVVTRPINVDLETIKDPSTNTSGFPQPSLTKNNPGKGE